MWYTAVSFGGVCPHRSADDASLRAAEEVRTIAAGDSKAMQEFMHPNYILNGPANRMARKDELIKLLAAGTIASDGLERTVEGTAIRGNVGIVMDTKR